MVNIVNEERVIYMIKKCIEEKPESIDKRDWPYNAVLVTYEIDGVVRHDHAAGPKNVKVFDAYYDLLKPLGGKILTMETMYGMVNPKLWGNKSKK